MGRMDKSFAQSSILDLLLGLHASLYSVFGTLLHPLHDEATPLQLFRVRYRLCRSYDRTRLQHVLVGTGGSQIWISNTSLDWWSRLVTSLDALDFFGVPDVALCSTSPERHRLVGV